ncbi:Predicted membrane protein [Corynebacterium pilosum]|uniref:Predicted membrane protein n=1 Tax=Corynebacterium pilosum TaxID=35756 RepID=A0A376GUE8_9CORY|nr:Predicted membrane protein [Corynebacterium pilosum]
MTKRLAWPDVAKGLSIIGVCVNRHGFLAAFR